MTGTIRKIVECVRDSDGQVFASYPLSYRLTLGPSAPPDMIKEAKDCLISDGFVNPPFDFRGISFRIRDA